MITKYCPKCKCSLFVDENPSNNQSSIECPYCDRSSAYSMLLDDPNQSPKGTAGGQVSASVAAQLIDSPDAGLVYIKNRFDNTDWTAYNESIEIIIPEIEEMVEKSKIKFGASPVAWQLDFESVAYPLNKKLEGLRENASKMAEKYSATDNTEILEKFDNYKNVVEAICDEKEALLKRLENAVKYAEQAQADTQALAEMNKTLAALKLTLEGMQPVKELYEIPEIKAAQDKIDAEIIKKFENQGIPVKNVYDEAMKMIDDDKADRNDLLRRLESIRGYSNVNEKVKEINRYYNFNHEYYNFCGRSFIFESKAKEILLDPKNVGKKGCFPKKDAKGAEAPVEDEYTGKTLHLYEVIDKKPSKEPILKDITQILTVYGTRLYYIKLNKSICYFDIVTKREFELDKGKMGDYIIDDMSKVFLNTAGNALFIRKRLPLEVLKKGCVDKLLKKGDEAIERKNNFSLVKISLVSDFSETAVKEMVDITEIRGDNIFYTKAEELSLEEIKKQAAAKKKAAKEAPVEGEDDEEEEIKLEFRVYNAATGDNRAILNDNCVIHTVVDGNVIFSKLTPNAYNKDLYSYNIENGEEILIESNILDYRFTNKGLVFYTVGNDDYCPLFSNTVAGDDRVEIMRDVENIIAIRAGWMYVIKRVNVTNKDNRIVDSFNALVKISIDGKTRVVVCLDFKQSIKITDMYMYYVDTKGSLRVARTDGKENTLIADDISPANIIVDKECIYYLRNEAVDIRRNAASLYQMNMDGHNVRKLLFDVEAIDNFDADNIMIKREEEALFEFTIPVDAKNTKTERREYDLTHFCKFNKKDGTIDTLLTLGLPNESEYEFKGCFGFGKKKKFNSTFKQIPKKITYKRANVAKAGAIFGAQATEQGVETLDPKEALNGCRNGGCAGGCSSLFTLIKNAVAKATKK